MKLTKSEIDAMHDEYEMAFPFCQIAQEIGVVWIERRGVIVMENQYVGLQIPAAHIHHVWHVARRPEMFANYCSIALMPHTLIHDGARGEARWIPMLCALAKCRALERTGDPKWFNLADANEATGRGGGLLGYAETLPDFGRADLRDWSEELRERVARLAKEAA